MHEEAVKVNDQESGIRQVYLGNKGLVAFISLMNMFVPLSIDMYLPALPTMNTYFSSSPAITNLTLSLFFLFYAVGILFWGPISDKYGRKRILLLGSIIYMICSVACALSFNIYFLIVARIFQGIGAGGITSISVAIIKDCFSGKKRETILAVCQSFTGLAPMLAPIIGGIILKFSDWRSVFWALAAISIINLILSILFQETLKDEERHTGTLMGSIKHLLIVGKNKSFIIPTIIFNLCALPFMGYIAVSSYIYEDYFGLSAQVYSYYYAANSLACVLGPVIYVKLLRNMEKKILASIVLGIPIVCGALVMTIGTISPLLFWLAFVFMALCYTVMRPFSVNMLLDQQKGDTGSAASLMSALLTIMGSLGMLVASMPWENRVIGLGALITIFSTIALVSWRLFIKSSIPCVGVKDI